MSTNTPDPFGCVTDASTANGCEAQGPAPVGWESTDPA